MQTFLIDTQDITYGNVNKLASDLQRVGNGTVIATPQFIVVVMNEDSQKEAYQFLVSYTERGLVADVLQSWMIMLARSDDSYGVKSGELVGKMDDLLNRDIASLRKNTNS